MTFIIMYALFFDDIRIIAFSKQYDDYFYGATAIGMVTNVANVPIVAILPTFDWYLTTRV